GQCRGLHSFPTRRSSDLRAGMGEENLQEFAAAQAGGEQLIEFLEAACHEVAHAEGPQVQAVLGDLLSDVDREALSGEYADYFARSEEHTSELQSPDHLVC